MHVASVVIGELSRKPDDVDSAGHCCDARSDFDGVRLGALVQRRQSWQEYRSTLIGCKCGIPPNFLISYPKKALAKWLSTPFGQTQILRDFPCSLIRLDMARGQTESGIKDSGRQPSRPKDQGSVLAISTLYLS